MITLEAMRLAVAVSHHRSFRRAAEELELRTSVLSRRIRALEDALGVSIFERSSGGVVQTLAGRSFLHRARAALADIDYAVSQAGVAGQGTSGNLSIGVFLPITSPVLRELVSRYVGMYPNVEINLIEGAPDNHIARIREGSLDVAFVPGRPKVADCEAKFVFSEQGFVALPLDHELSDRPDLAWPDIHGETMIVRKQQPGPWLQEYVSQRLKDLGHYMRIIRFDVSRENLIHLVGLGFGITLASPATASIPYPHVTFRLLRDAEDLDISAVWTSRNDNPSLRRFIALLRASPAPLAKA